MIDGPLLESDTSGSTGPFSNASDDGFQWGFRAKSLQKAKSLPKNGDFGENVKKSTRFIKESFGIAREFRFSDFLKRLRF